jgi:hypothetical protein
MNELHAWQVRHSVGLPTIYRGQAVIDNIFVNLDSVADARRTQYMRHNTGQVASARPNIEKAKRRVGSNIQSLCDTPVDMRRRNMYGTLLEGLI